MATIAYSERAGPPNVWLLTPTRGSGCDVACVLRNNVNFHRLYLHNKRVRGRLLFPRSRAKCHSLTRMNGD